MEAGGRAVASKVPATILMWLSFGLGSAGFLVAGVPNEGAVESLHTVTAVVVGGVGVVSFLRHAVFARSDAVRMGWSGEGGSNFQLEVGFANFAFGLAALIAHFEDWAPAQRWRRRSATACICSRRRYSICGMQSSGVSVRRAGSS